MDEYTLPDDQELERVLALKEQKILDTEKEESFEQIVEQASLIFEMPIVAISLVDENRQWFKASYGLSVRQTARSVSFCSHAIKTDAPFIIEDAKTDQRFSENPLVTAPPFIRFYAGISLKSEGGHRIGTLCLIDHKPRKLSDDQMRIHKLLALQCQNLIIQRYKTIQSNTKLQNLKKDTNKNFHEKSLLTLINNSFNSGILFFDEKGNISYWNSWVKSTFRNFDFNNLHRLEPNTIKNFLGLTEAHSTEFLKTLELHIQKQETYLIVDQETKDGKFFDIECIPIFEMSEFKGSVLKIRDTTDKVLLKKQIESQQIQISESLRLKALGEMAGGLSHEINNPLAILRGRLYQIEQMAESNTMDSKQVILITQQCKNVLERITKIAKGLRAFARGGENDPFETVGIHSIVDETLTFCHTRIKDLGILLDIKSEKSDILVHCRPIQISQILLNLLNNACDSLEEKTDQKIIKISFSMSDDYAFIQVEDTGSGIPETVVNSIFTPFFTTKPPNRGTGMGLSISRRIAMENDGDLILTSRMMPTGFCLKLKRSAV